MGYGCTHAQNDVYAQVARPVAGDALEVRTGPNGRKYLVCRKTRTTSCLSPGDRVVITMRLRRSQRKYLSGAEHMQGTFQMSGDADYFILDNQQVLYMGDMSRTMGMTVISVVPQSHEHPAQPVAARPKAVQPERELVEVA